MSENAKVVSKARKDRPKIKVDNVLTGDELMAKIKAVLAECEGK